MQLCNEMDVAIVPQAGNTGLTGGAIASGDRPSAILNVSRLNRVRDIDVRNNSITVESGFILENLRSLANENNRLFPMLLGSVGSCEVGGLVSTNAGGTGVLRYGNMRDLTLGLEVVLPDGQIWNGLRGLRKDNTGYDLKHLFIGSEGTLGIITAAVLKLFPVQAVRAVAWVAVPDPAAAIALLAHARTLAGERLSAFEIVCSAAHELVLQKFPACTRPLAAPSPWYALLELTDSDAQADLQTLLENLLGKAFDQGLVTDAALAASETQALALWALRENISDAQKLDGISIKHDISLPVSAIPEFLERCGDALSAAYPGVRIVAFGHAGDGNLHYNPSMPQGGDENAGFIAQTAAVNRIVYDLVVSLGGSISAEHGLGQLKREEIRRYKSPLELDMMHRIRQALDPAGLMNPGKLVD